MDKFEPPVKNIKGLQFSIMSPDEIRNKSVVEITKRETYDKDVPVVKGLFDIRMGTTDMGKLCNTCGLNNMECPGHFGHIELARPVYNYQFMDIIIKILKCVCFRCSKLLINKDKPIIESICKKCNRDRWDEIYKLSSNIGRCGHETENGCGCKQPDRYKLNPCVGIEAIWKSMDKKQNIQAEYVKALFEKITDEDCNLLGLSSTWCRPEWLICSVVPVPPPAVRPSVKQGDSQRMDDDLTHKLSDIIQFNNGLKKKIESGCRSEIIDDWTNQVQYHVATLIDNELPGVNQSTHRSGRPLKSICQRLKGKEGRIRSNLMGKRVDFSARSVITPDPNIDLDELGVPLKIAMNLTFPEKVNDFNIEKLALYIKNGTTKWPGVKSIIKKNKKKISITSENKNDIVLEKGDIVNRHLIDGDYVLFNRQPSLHKMSMMGHRVKVMKIGNTFRLNVSVTPPYNADFDGDEMNMHVPQSYHSLTELINIASVNNQIISPRENKPIITIVQDTLLGIYKLTNSEIIEYEKGKKFHFNENTNIYDIENDSSTNKCVESCYYTKKQMMNIICDLSTYKGKIPDPDKIIQFNGNGVELWSGKCILSYIIPENINVKMQNSLFDNNRDINTDDENISNNKKLLVENNDLMNIVNIVDGYIKKGTFDKNLFSKTSKGLIHTINNDLGNMRAHDFINDLQKIASYILLVEGFSVGISDMIADNNTNLKIKDIIKEKKKKINIIEQEIHLDIFEGFPGQSNKDFFESKVNSILNEIISNTGKVALSNLDEKNRVTFMINSGSKGKLTNIAQMVACLGQQNVDGKRIPYGFNDRTLPHYYKFDDSSEARGFVENSFISGQTPQEFFFHAMGGREGLIDTAVKTSETGYIQRQLMKSMEDLKVHFDYSVRDNSGTIVQFIYGDDGMDGTFIESQPLIITKLSIDDIADKFYYNKKTNWKKHLNKKTYEEFSKLENIEEIMENSYKKILNHREYLIYKIFNGNIENNINYPVHIQRIVTNFTKINSKMKKKSNIDPIEIFEENQKLIDSLYITEEFKNNKIIEILVDVHLNPKILINEFNITKEQYKLITSYIYTKFNDCIISPGEMVGPIAAQSIGEPATQMTLNTFHFAGVSAKSNVTRGIPRLKELLHLSKNIKSPSTTIFLNPEYNDKNKSKYVKNSLEYTTFKDIVISTSIHYDPNNLTETIIDEDKEMIEIYKEFCNLECNEEDYKSISPWIIRYKFNKELMMDKGIVMEDTYLALLNYDPTKLIFTYTDDNSKELIGRISLITDEDIEAKPGIQDQTDIISTFKNINEDILNNIVIKGIKNITDIIVSENNVINKINHENISNKEYTLITEGVNLLEIMNNDYINENKCYSNNIIEIYEILGIEATREILMKEIIEVVEHASEYINLRHILLLCDSMTSKGELISINRQGIKKSNIGPLAKCSFEDTTDQLIKSSIFSEIDNLTGVSSNIMMGQMINSGTGYSDILLDENQLLSQLSQTGISEEDFYEIDHSNIDNLLDVEDDHDDCNDENFKFSFE